MASFFIKSFCISRCRRTDEIMGSYITQAKHFKFQGTWGNYDFNLGLNFINGFQQIWAAMCNIISRQNHKDLGFEKFDSSCEHFARPSIPSQESTIFTTSRLAVGLRVVWYERPLLRLEKPSRAIENQACSTFRIRFSDRLQFVWWKIGWLIELGWSYPCVGMGSTSANHYMMY